MIRVGLVGVGMMGGVHLDVYARQKDVKVAAIADRIEDKRTGKARTALNVTSQQQGFTAFDAATQYAEGIDLIQKADVDLVDLCIPTPQHVDLAIAALQSGKHVLVEKPLARTAADAARLVAAAKASNKYIMNALCMRFWPGWSWLKETVDSGRFGKVLAAQFRRCGSFPGGWYSNANDSGGAALDLHVHDVDFIQYLFGLPKAVRTVGYSRETQGADHLMTQYLYDTIPFVSAEGGWAMAQDYGFSMQYCVNFEQATAVFDLSKSPTLQLMVRGKGKTPVEVPPGMGYDYEIPYLLNCIKTGTPPTQASVESAANAIRMVEAELESIRTGREVALKNA